MSASETMHSAQAEPAHHLAEDQRTAEDHVLPACRQTGPPGPHRHRFESQDVAPARDRLQAQDSVMDPLPVVLHQPQLHAGERRDGAGQADESPGAEARVRQRGNGRNGAVQFGRNGLATAAATSEGAGGSPAQVRAR